MCRGADELGAAQPGRTRLGGARQGKELMTPIRLYNIPHALPGYKRLVVQMSPEFEAQFNAHQRGKRGAFQTKADKQISPRAGRDDRPVRKGAVK